MCCYQTKMNTKSLQWKNSHIEKKKEEKIKTT